MYKGKRWIYRQEAQEGAEGGGTDVVVDEGQPPEIAPDVLEKAEKMGWTPKDQFRGDPAKWRPADEFVERGENMLPIVRATVKRQEREIADLKQSMKQFAEYHDKTEQRAIAKAMDDLKGRRAAAIAAGDGAAFDRVDDEIDSLKKEIDAKPKPVKADESDPVFDEWLGRNKWAEDPKLQLFGAKYGEFLVESGEAARGNDLLELVAKEVRRAFPEKFENPRRAAAPSVESGAPSARKGGKSFADLPADARAACERMARNGYADKPKEAAAFRAEYTKTYFSEE